MSALNFYGTSGQTANNRYYTFTFPALPNSDWCIGCWMNLTNISNGSYETPFSQAALPSTTSPGCGVFMDGAGANGTSTLTAFEYGTGSTYGDFLSTTPTFSGQAALVVIQRQGANFQLYVVNEGGTATGPSASGTFQGTTIPSQANSFIGDAPGNPTINQGWTNTLGEFFILNSSSLTAAQITALATGQPITTQATPYVYLPFRNGAVSVEPNQGSGGNTYNASIVGTGFSTSADFFALPSSGSNILRIPFGPF